MRNPFRRRSVANIVTIRTENGPVHTIPLPPPSWVGPNTVDIDVTLWREGFFAAVAAWLQEREPSMDIARVTAVDEDIDITPGNSVADEELEVSLSIRYVDSTGATATHYRLGKLGDVIREITS